MAETGEENFRLPDSVTPERYEIRLAPDLRNSSFSGEETITVVVRQAVTEIVLNALDLEIDSAAIAKPGEEQIAGTVTVDSANEQTRLGFPQLVEPGTWLVRIAFHGQLNERLAGFYRSTYTTDDGEERVLAATQFEATDARRAFPCWDEPAFKAVFSVMLVVDEQLTAISNGPVVRETAGPEPGKKTVVFGDTVRMSTYLVAFIVGEFEGSEPATVAGVPLRVWSVPSKRHLTGFATAAGAFALSFYADYYAVPYPGPKLDLIAIPDFAFGAMENLGAVTFRETALLLDEQTATTAEQERVATVVAHELAHMWFGDLVTMRWWNGLWLNEAFATFMEMLAVDAWKPEWETWVSFGSSRAAAFLIDGLHSSRPIEFTVRRPEEAQAMFDVLTYEKGAAVLRMLEQYLGARSFQQGISLYLQRHAFGNAETGDLWDAIESATHDPVRRTMDSWIFQPGYPLITVESENGGLRLSQQRFLYLGSDESSALLWQVPIMLRGATANAAIEQRLLLCERSETAELPAGPEWLVANAGGHGFYRVRYSSDLLQRLMPRIQSDLSAIERFNLISDTWAAALAGYVPLTEFLALTERFHDEMDDSVWSIILSAFGFLRRTMGAESRSTVAALVRERLRVIYQRLGWSPRDDESPRTRQLRGTVLSSLGVTGEDAAIQSAARERYAAYRRDPSAVDVNIVPALVGILAHAGDTDRYEEFWREFKAAKTPQDMERYLFALAGFRQQELLTKTLEHTIDGQVRSQDAPYLIRGVMTNPEGATLAWEFVKQHWDELNARFPENAIPRMVEGVTSLATPELEADVKHFFATHEVKQAGKHIEQHLERLHMSVLFRQREAASLKAYPVGPSS